MELPPFLVSIAPMLFIGIFIFIFGFVIFMLFSKRGGNVGADIQYGGKLVCDFGEIAHYPIPLGYQKLRLLGYEKDGEQFLVLEVSDEGIQIRRTWVKIDDSTLQAINNIVKKA